ncbi:MAG: glycosyl hydrolase 115 family protein [Pseudomonadota bacterium]|nr:glycosyl hydrolase 115 family protein [Pseudomonadota bacterium]
MVPKFALIPIAFGFLAQASPGAACTTVLAPCTRDLGGSFGLIRQARPAQVYVDAGADKAVRHVADNFVKDLTRVAGKRPVFLSDVESARGELVVIGVLGQSPVIDQLVRSGKIAAADLAGRWEAFRQIVVDEPFPNVRRALVIVGSDRRGAIFGTYDISQKIGVSPWHWWADVPVEKRSNLFLMAGSRRDEPRVKYRGFFINDEEPAFGNWAREKFGGINAKLYEHVFELNLRLKGNYLWPAMWGKAFNDDDPGNMVLADEMGIIMGTSHHEPMMRAQDEWHRNKERGITGGAWDYTKNAEKLRTFWRGGIERMVSKPAGGAYESLVTIGMRGDGDEPMTEGTAIELLERIVSDQRRIIQDVTGRPASETPQVWALYKEVQDYHDKGMKVPEDVLLLFADDNWGQIRRLPTRDRERKGGYGVYYHFDYVGGPRNYKWLNTNQIEKVWQQMNLAYESGADDLWIVNVGDIKPMEFPLTFFMDMAWNPEAMTLDALSKYPEQWAAETFGPAQAKGIGRLLTDYSKLAARRKPELVDAGSFRLGNGTSEGGEFGKMVLEWQALERAARAVRRKIGADQADAYFQLVQHPIMAMSNLYTMHYNVAQNRRLAAANDWRANAFAEAAGAAFRRDREIAAAYHAMRGGKWNHMMAQTHIGYMGWQQPEKDVMPEVKRVSAPATSFLSDQHQPLSRLARATAPPRKQPYVSIEAPNFSRATNGRGLLWRAIPHLGRTLGAVAAFPQGRPSTSPSDNVRLEYDIELAEPAEASLLLYMVPTLDVRGSGGIRIGVSIDDGPVQTLNFDLIPDQPAWSRAVSENAHIVKAPPQRLSAGRHSIKIWRLDDNAVLQKLVVDLGGLPPTYLGPEQNVKRAPRRLR